MLKNVPHRVCVCVGEQPLFIGFMDSPSKHIHLYSSSARSVHRVKPRMPYVRIERRARGK